MSGSSFAKYFPINRVNRVLVPSMSVLKIFEQGRSCMGASDCLTIVTCDRCIVQIKYAARFWQKRRWIILVGGITGSDSMCSSDSDGFVPF